MIGHVYRWFLEGGWPMWVLLGADVCLIGLFVVGLGVAGVLRGTTIAKLIGGVLIVLALAPAVIGAGGYFWGMHQVNQALMNVDPSERAVITEEGRAEAMNNVWFGGGSLLCTLPAAALVLGIAMTGSRRVADGT